LVDDCVEEPRDGRDSVLARDSGEREPALEARQTDVELGRLPEWRQDMSRRGLVAPEAKARRIECAFVREDDRPPGRRVFLRLARPGSHREVGRPSATPEQMPDKRQRQTRAARFAAPHDGADIFERLVEAAAEVADEERDLE